MDQQRFRPPQQVRVLDCVPLWLDRSTFALQQLEQQHHVSFPVGVYLALRPPASGNPRENWKQNQRLLRSHRIDYATATFLSRRSDFMTLQFLVADKLLIVALLHIHTGVLPYHIHVMELVRPPSRMSNIFLAYFRSFRSDPHHNIIVYPWIIHTSVHFSFIHGFSSGFVCCRQRVRRRLSRRPVLGRYRKNLLRCGVRGVRRGWLH